MKSFENKSIRQRKIEQREAQEAMRKMHADRIKAEAERKARINQRLNEVIVTVGKS